MSWEDVPDFIVNARDRMLESATIATTLGIRANQFHWPRAVPTDMVPLVVIDDTEPETVPAGAGSTYIYGTITGVILVPAADFTIGKLTQYGRLIGPEIVGLLTDGIFVKRFKCSRVGEPGPGFWALKDSGQPEAAVPPVRALPFVMDWGDP